MTPDEVSARMLPLVLKQLNSQYGWIFKEPVDPVKMGLLDYFEIVKRPMDLGTVRMALEQSGYKDVNDVAADVKLTFDNALLYNAPGQFVWMVAKALREEFFNDFSKVKAHLSAH